MIKFKNIFCKVRHSLSVRLLLLGLVVLFSVGYQPLEQDSNNLWAVDIEAFRTSFFEIDQSYAPDARAQAEELLSDLENEAEQLSHAEFELRLARIASLADNGHTLLLTPRWTGVFNRLPVKFLITSDGLYIAQADETYADLTGARVVTIEGRSWKEIQDIWRRYQGGEDGWRQQFIYFFLESPEILYAAGIARHDNRTSIRVEKENGETVTVVIEARQNLPPLEGFEAYVPPARIVYLTRQLPAETNEVLPLYLQDLDQPFFWKSLPAIDAVYIHFKSNVDFSGEQDIRVFAEEVTAMLHESQPRFIILDQRFNFGGDLTTTRDLMQLLPEIVGPQGLVFAISSSRTFSAGISSLGYLKQAGQKRVIIIGEPVGDRLNFWAEGDLLELPVSGAAFLYATERHNYMTGCPEDDCHIMIQLFPIQIKTLEPDHHIYRTYEDFAQGRDPSMEKVMELIEAVSD